MNMSVIGFERKSTFKISISKIKNKTTSETEMIL